MRVKLLEIHTLRCLASASFRQKTEDPEILRNLPPTEIPQSNFPYLAEFFFKKSSLLRCNFKILLGDALFNERAKVPVHQYLWGISCDSRGPRGIVVKA